MYEFSVIKDAVDEQFSYMQMSELFVTATEKDKMWDTYLSSFPEGTNPIFRERSEHDCQCCKQFIRAVGNVVAIKDNKLISIWDIEVPGFYQDVADAMSAYVKSKVVCNTFLYYQKVAGVDFNHQETEEGDIIKWTHFFSRVKKKFVAKKDVIGSRLSTKHSNKDVCLRGLEEITLDAAETVLELIEQNSIYRGEEHKRHVKIFIKYKKKFDKVRGKKKRDNFAWLWSVKEPSLRIRNAVIGTLLTDVSDGMLLDEAVRLFETKTAPQNYKRTSAIITKSMIANAQKKVAELGIEDALQRRYAVMDDITINNVLFADRTAKEQMGVFDELANAVPDKLPKNFDKVEEVDIEKFMGVILPKAESLELMVENRHENNLVSLIAPMVPDAKPIFKWNDNNFSWSYKGEVTDSMKERVKKAGGNVTGVLRFSIQWNDNNDNQNDFDAHCYEPNGNLIHYPSHGRTHPSSGILDVDIIHPGRNVAVENITWSSKRKMQEGTYMFLVHCFGHKGGKTGFTAEIEYDGQIYRYAYNKELRQSEKVIVAELKYSAKDGIQFIKSLDSTHATKEVWGINTTKFHKVRTILHSPNHWDGHATGNKHYFFMLEGCNNPDKARGFYNEFLDETLRDHRKVFEVLASKMKTKETDNQLSGLGFSSTKKTNVLCKVSGAFNRIIKIKF